MLVNIVFIQLVSILFSIFDGFNNLISRIAKLVWTLNLWGQIHDSKLFLEILYSANRKLPFQIEFLQNKCHLVQCLVVRKMMLEVSIYFLS